MRCWNMGMQMWPTNFHSYNRATMLIIVPTVLLSHLGSNSASISTTLQTRVGQEIKNDDINDILGGNNGCT